MNSPKVSIIMAAYTRVDMLPWPIDRVLRQTLPDWELIIVDDVTSDNTREVTNEVGKGLR
jgi:glycosyltransferase involved in cell wall biosynthesis